MALQFVKDLVEGASTVASPGILEYPCHLTLQGAAGAGCDGVISGTDGASGDIGVGRCSAFGGRKYGGEDDKLPCRALRLIAELPKDKRATHSA